MTLTPPKTKLSISNPVYGKGRRYAGERQRNDECGELDECLRAPCDRGSGGVSVTVGVTGVVTMISSALRRMWPAFYHAFNRRPARIRFQPHCRASSAAFAVTRPSG